VVNWSHTLTVAREASEVRKYLGKSADIGFAITVITAIIAVAGCSGSDGVPVTVTGVVLHDGDHSPLAGVQVTDNSAVTTTNADGEFALRLGNSRDTTIYAVLNGYEVEARAVPAGAGANGEKPLAEPMYMKPVIVSGCGKVVGIVADAGAPVEGANVWVGGKTAVTDANGAYTLYNVPVGQRTVTAAIGDKSGTASVLVISLRQVTANIAVTLGPPPGPLSN